MPAAFSVDCSSQPGAEAQRWIDSGRGEGARCGHGGQGTVAHDHPGGDADAGSPHPTGSHQGLGERP